MIKRGSWILAALALLGLGGWYYNERQNQAPVGAGGATVRVQRGNMSRTVTATGVIKPVVGAEINVGSRVSGMVLELRVQVGDRVKAGDLLARLDPVEFEARAAQARADLAMARAQLSLAEHTVQRAATLLDKGFGTQEDLEKAERDLDVAKARIELGRARLKSAEIDSSHTLIQAPIKGVIAEVATREGETVAANFSAPTFVTIIDLDRLQVRAFVDETDIGRIFVGQKAVFTVDAYPDADIPAWVTAIYPKAEIQGSVVNYVVILEFRTPGPQILRPEMTTHIRLTLEERANVITAPRNVLRRRDGRFYVMVKRNKTWVEQAVQIGWRTESKAEILEGLREGETVRVN